MTWGRRLFKRLALILGGLFCLYLAAGQIIGPWAVRSYVRSRAADQVKFDSVRSVWPLGVAIENLRVADPAGELDFLLKVPKATFRVPWWGGLVRPIPVQITLESPHMKVSGEKGGREGLEESPPALPAAHLRSLADRERGACPDGAGALRPQQH